MPEDCPIRKDNEAFLGAVQPFFFQRWCFFAPPPERTDRVYFIYKSSKDPKNSKILEITRAVTRNKSLKNLDNEDARILDYIIAGLKDQTQRSVISMRLYTKDLNVLDQVTIDSQVDLKCIVSWKKYARIVAEQNSLPHSLDTCSVEIASLPIPDFEHRSQILEPYSAPAQLICQISPFYVYKTDRYPQTTTASN